MLCKAFWNPGVVLAIAVVVGSSAFGADKRTTTTTTFKYNDKGRANTKQPAKKLTGKKRPARGGKQEVDYLKHEKWN
jgi:hypothetical protein